MNKEFKALLYAKKKGYRVNRDGIVYSPDGNTLKLHENSSGYLGFTVYFSQRSQTIRVHKFCAYEIFGNSAYAGRKSCVRHLDGNKKNNKWSNLELGSYRENSMDIPRERRVEIAIKGNGKRCGEGHGMTTLTNKQIKEIRSLYKRTAPNKSNARSLGEKYGVTRTTITNIVTGKTWKQILQGEVQ